MADIAFTWTRMESDLEDPDYTKNYLHSKLADFTKHKERLLDNIWLLRKDHEKYWLLGRLLVDNSTTAPNKDVKPHWIRFDPKKSEFYSNPLEVQSALGETLIKISKRMFGGDKNGHGSSSLIEVGPFETITLNKLLGTQKKVSFDEFIIKIKSGEISGVPFRKVAMKREVKSSSINTSPSKGINIVRSEQLFSDKATDLIKDKLVIANSVDSSSTSKLESDNNKFNAELVSENISSEILDALKLIAKEIDDEYKNKPGMDVDAIVKRRVGQSEFRSLLEVKHEAKCHVSQIDKRKLLIASHIVPWSKSTGDEKTDSDNGLLLAVNWDAVFDKGLISFDDQGKVVFSDDLDEETSNQLGLSRNVTLREGVLTSGRKKYLQRHRQDVFESWKKSA